MGRVMLSGGKVRMEEPRIGYFASEIAVGNSVFMTFDGVPTEFIVINQGIPSGSSTYDSSCDGTWLIMKDCCATNQWGTYIINNAYSRSEYTETVSVYLKNTILPRFGPVEQNIVREVKIPYADYIDHAGGTGANGHPTKLFLLSYTELTGYYIPYTGDGYYSKTKIYEGGKLSYLTTADERRAFYNGLEQTWWLRTPYFYDSFYYNYAYDSTLYNTPKGGYYLGIRPALVLPFNALFDTKTLLLKGGEVTWEK